MKSDFLNNILALVGVSIAVERHQDHQPPAAVGSLSQEDQA